MTRVFVWNHRTALINSASFALLVVTGYALDFPDTATALALDCPAVNGCSDTAIVPCNNATCVGMGLYPNGPFVLCVDGEELAESFTATSVTSWFKCFKGQDTDPVCNSRNTVCATVMLYWGNVCDAAHICNVDSIDACQKFHGQPCL